MRALIVYRVDISIFENGGVARKLQGQGFGFVQNGYEVDSIYLSEHGLYKNNVLVKPVSHSKIPRNLFKIKHIYDEIIKNVDAKEYVLILVRHHLILPGFVRMLQHFKDSNPKVKVVIDLPTYPYYQEWEGAIGKQLLKIDAKNRVDLQPYTDLILHYGAEKELFGIPCLQSTNGILPTGKRYSRAARDPKVIHLLAVGKWRYWHGLERVIIGLSNFYRKEHDMEITLHVVGDGEELAKYKAIVLGEGISERVVFHGGLSGNELDLLIEKADLGIGTLALYKKNVFIDSSLKHRSYCQHGLPFILYNEDLDFPAELDFVYYIPHDGCVQMEELIDFYNRTKKVDEISEKMLAYAEANLNWSCKISSMLEGLSLPSQSKTKV